MTQLTTDDINWSVKRQANAAAASSALGEVATQIQSFVRDAKAKCAAGNGSQWSAIDDFVNTIQPKAVAVVQETFLDPDVVKWLVQQPDHIPDPEHYLRDLENIASRITFIQSKLSGTTSLAPSTPQSSVPTSNSNAAPPNDSSLASLRHLLHRFHIVAAQLQERYDHRPTLTISDEYDVQNLLHALLRLHFDDVRPEEWTPSYAGKSSRVDFFLKPQQTVIEAKKTRHGLGEKELGDELIIDIHRYSQMAACKILICFVYDPAGLLRNPRGFEADLGGQRNNVLVEVIVGPRQ
jgi:hypothetical protein